MTLWQANFVFENHHEMYTVFHEISLHELFTLRFQTILLHEIFTFLRVHMKRIMLGFYSCLTISCKDEKVLKVYINCLKFITLSDNISQHNHCT